MELTNYRYITGKTYQGSKITGNTILETKLIVFKATEMFPGHGMMLFKNCASSWRYCVTSRNGGGLNRVQNLSTSQYYNACQFDISLQKPTSNQKRLNR